MTLSDDEKEWMIGYERIKAKYSDSVEANISYLHSGQVGNTVAKFQRYTPPAFQRHEVRIVA